MNIDYFALKIGILNKINTKNLHKNKIWSEYWIEIKIGINLTYNLLMKAGFKYKVSFLQISSHILLTSIGSDCFSKLILISWIYFFYLPDLLSFMRYTTATVGGLYLRAKFIGYAGKSFPSNEGTV